MASTFLDSRQQTIKNEMLYDNVLLWHEHNLQGQGINIWSVENSTGSHSNQTAERVKHAAPQCNLYRAVPFLSVDSKGNCTIHTVTYEGVKYEIEDFIIKYNIKILTSSKEDYFGNADSGSGKFWKELAQKHDLCLFQSSGNNHKNKDFNNRAAYIVSACILKEDTVIYEKYSDYGEGIDFTDFTGGLRGTSFSTPYLAGKAALIRQRYPQYTNIQVYNYLKSCCEDTEEKGRDIKTGHGIVILPIIESKRDDEMITKTQILISKNGESKIVEVDRILKDGTNYIRLRDFEDILGICSIDYDEKQKLPIVKQ